MTSDLNTALTEACSPDADRAGLPASARLPDHLAHLFRLIVLFLLDRIFAADPRRARLPSWWHYRPDLPPGSVQQLAASIRGEFGNAIAWMAHRFGINPGHPDWPEVSRAIVAFGGSVKGFRAGAPRCPQQWWENPDIIPGMTRAPREPLFRTPGAPAEATASPPPWLSVARPPLPGQDGIPVPIAHARLAAVWPRPLARLGTGPPTGPPAVPTRQLSCLMNGAGARPAPPS